ncbi:MAG: hypothetical protein ACYC7D_14985 [Nitrososphaerales archaeon]
MADLIFIILLTLHVGGVITWTGSSVMYSLVIGPSLAKTDVAELKPEFAISMFSKISKFITAASIITLLAGFFLFDYISTVATYILPAGPRILFIYAGAMLGFAAFVLTLAAVMPTTNRIIKILRSRVLIETSSSSGKVALVSARRVEIMNSAHALRSGLAASSAILLLVFVLMILGTNL